MCRFLIVFSLLVLTSCGPKSTSNRLIIKDSSIMNGTDVKASDVIASSTVGVFDAKNNAICTGTLISSNIVLTAAHCAPDRASDMKIVFSNDLDDTMYSRELDILQEYVLPVTDFKVGPTWNPNNETIEIDTGDIALVKFKGNLPRGFKPANFLADVSAIKKGAIVTVAGFGVNLVKTTKIDPKTYRNLEEAIQYGEVFCDEENGKKVNCFSIESSGDGILRTTTAPIASIYKTEIRLDERRAGTCNGDSGGPAFIQQNGQLYLFGVTSRGSALCNEVGVYTNALYYGSWIVETSKILK